MRRRVGLATALTLALTLFPAAVPALAAEVGSATLVPIQVTGPPTQRLNLIILGDGYTEGEQQKFRDDVDRNQNVQWSVEPFRSYREYFNIYRLEIISGVSGIRCDPDDPPGGDNTRITPLRLWYSDGCSNPLARGTTYGPAPVPGSCDFLGDLNCSGIQQHNLYLDTYVTPVLGIPRTSQNIQTLAIFNSFTYGGIGGTQATTSGGSPQGPLISLHELGHSLGAMADEYPYSSRDVVKPCYAGSEPGSFHHTIRTSTQNMIDTQFKWWRWMDEESLSGGTIGLHEGGNTFPCGVRRPSEHSIMRWIEYHWDQVGLEHMVARMAGLRNSGQMPLPSRAAGTVGSDEVLWVDPPQPRNHGLTVTWRIGGPSGDVVDTNNTPFLDPAQLQLAPETIVHVEVRDPVGPDGIDWVRNPSTGNTATNSGYNGPRFVQTRQWTVGGTPVTPSPAGALITTGTLNNIPVAGHDWVYIETNHPSDRVIDVTWELDGNAIPNPHNLRNLDVGALGLAPGTYQLRATATDPAGGDPATREWTVDNTLPTAPRTLTPNPLATLPDSLEHNVYFGEFEMLLEPEDDQPGFVVGELRLDQDGWFNYFGFPEQPFGTPFKFAHSGTSIKALTYGNLGTGGLSKATFEQFFSDETDPKGEFEPGYGTHLVEHRAIDAAGNIGQPGQFRATVLPKSSPACTTTITGTRTGVVNVNNGVTCLDGATLNGGVKVKSGASLVVLKGSTIHGVFTATGANVVQVFGADVTGDTTITGTTSDVILAGSTFTGSVTLTGNTSSDIAILSGETRNYGVIVIGNEVGQDLSCSANSPLVNDFDAPNQVAGSMTGQCSSL